MNAQDVTAAATILIAMGTLGLACGVYVAVRQVATTQKAIKAQVLIALFEQWQSDKIYQSIKYVHNLRRTWKNLATGSKLKWTVLAERWVEEHANADPNSKDDQERRLWSEWEMRRTASQFLAKMGALVHAGYLTPDELFRVIPEAGRLLIVLWPIEKEIQNYWKKEEGLPLKDKDWDHPAPKWEFKLLWEAYEPWYKLHSKECQLPDFPTKITWE